MMNPLAGEVHELGVKTRPILFSGEMVQALLEGRKTQTRRVIKPQPPPNAVLHEYEEYKGFRAVFHNDPATGGPNYRHTVKCPYGMPGDRLYVREAFRYEWEGAMPGIRYRADDAWKGYHRVLLIEESSWKPSIHMPRWAARITLKVESVRVERVQDIAYDDAKAEGLKKVYNPNCTTLDDAYYLGPPNNKGMCVMHGVPQSAFAELWDKINAARGYSWESNPFVWRVTFKRLMDPA